MKYILKSILIYSFLTITGCAIPPTADPSKVEQNCAQQCSGHLSECSSGFKFFPVVAQQQCNDTYDVCIKGCPARLPIVTNDTKIKTTVSERLNKLKKLLKSDTISQEEYDIKRKEIINSI